MNESNDYLILWLLLAVGTHSAILKENVGAALFAIASVLKAFVMVMNWLSQKVEEKP